MRKVLVLEDGVINEYEIDYDQEYMDIRLEEYRKSFSSLINFYANNFGECSKEVIKDSSSYLDDIASFSVSFDERDGSKDLIKVNLVGSINPALYTILNDGNGSFSIDDRKMSAVLCWYIACEDEEEERNNDVLNFDDYYNLNERKNIKDNIKNLFDGVSLRYIGRSDSPITKEQDYSARVVSQFIDEFDIKVEKDKRLVK